MELLRIIYVFLQAKQVLGQAILIASARKATLSCDKNS